MRLLGTGAERGLLARRLEAVGLEDALEGLGRRPLAGATAAGGLEGGRRKRSGHFV